MALILSIDTSSKNCSVSLAKDGTLINTLEEYNDSFSHAENLHFFCDKLMRESECDFKDIDAYAFSEGPGSYTGLRIGAAAIKGFSFSFEKPVILVSTLHSMAFSNNIKSGLLCPLMDSRVGEVYMALYDTDIKCLIDPHSHVLSEKSLLDFLKTNKIYFFGTGLEKVLKIIKHKNAYFTKNIVPSSRYLVEIAEAKYHKKEFADISNFEPLYLKEFIATKQRKNII